MSKPKSLKTDFRSHDKWLVIALNLGPLAALSNLTLSYMLAEESCVRGSKLILHASAAAFFALTIVAVFIARSSGAAAASAAGSSAPESLHERTQWMVNAAIVLAIAAAVLIVAMEIPNLVLRSCD